MEKRSVQIDSKTDSALSINIIPGHFATNHSHVNYYIDMTAIKMQLTMAKEAGIQLSMRYLTIPIDTIICMDGCEIVGGFLANELIKRGSLSINSGSDINVVQPEFNSNGQIIFRDNVQRLIWGKHVLLLIASATTGKTINRSLECIKYYGGKVSGIAAIFSAIDSKQDIPIDALFTNEDLPNYQSYSFTECPYCKEHQKIDAIVNSFGYSKI